MIQRRWRCRAADSDVATQDEIEAMEDGATAIPEDPAGNAITGGQPAPGRQGGAPPGKLIVACLVHRHIMFQRSCTTA